MIWLKVVRIIHDVSANLHTTTDTRYLRSQRCVELYSEWNKVERGYAEA